MRSALILGDAAGVHVEAAEAQCLFSPDVVIAVNNIGITWPHVDHWVTLHIDDCPNWCGLAEAVRRRALAGLNTPTTWAHKPARGVDRHTEDWTGGSGLLAVKIAIFELGIERVVLGGMPMSDAVPHFYTSEPWRQAPRYHRGWIAHHKEIAPFVRSMSGWTREQFGPPDKQWLAAA